MKVYCSKANNAFHIIMHFIFDRILPESTRWLIVKNRYAEARQLILKAGEMNGKLVPEHLIVIEDVNEKEEKVGSFRFLSISLLENN